MMIVISDVIILQDTLTSTRYYHYPATYMHAYSFTHICELLCENLNIM